MLGATLQISRGHGEDRFCNPSKTWRGYHQHLQYLRRSRSSSSAGLWSLPPLVFKEKASVPECFEPENRIGSEVGPSNAQPVSASSSLCSSSVPENALSSNLDRFLESTTPSIAAQLFYKRTMGGCRTCDVECRPYFTLAELWDSFKEWSAYGASVPLILNDSDCVVQYYVPYLSGIQLYGKYSGIHKENSSLICAMLRTGSFMCIVCNGLGAAWPHSLCRVARIIHAHTWVPPASHLLCKLSTGDLVKIVIQITLKTSLMVKAVNIILERA